MIKKLVTTFVKYPFYAKLIIAILETLPTEPDSPAGRVNVFMIVATFLLTVLSLLSKGLVDIIAIVMDRKDEAAYVPLYFMGSHVLVDFVSPLLKHKLDRKAELVAEETAEETAGQS